MKETTYIITEYEMGYEVRFETDTNHPSFQRESSERNGAKIIYEGTLSADKRTFIQQAKILFDVIQLANRAGMFRKEDLEKKLACFAN